MCTASYKVHRPTLVEVGNVQSIISETFNNLCCADAQKCL